ncbi:MAG: hypothetical protein ACREF3_19855 [Acetobacteraceae bacterium]
MRQACFAEIPRARIVDDFRCSDHRPTPIKKAPVLHKTCARPAAGNAWQAKTPPSAATAGCPKKQKDEWRQIE